MTCQKSPLFSKVGTLMFSLALIGASAALRAAEYVPPQMDEATCEKGATSGKDITGVTSSDWYFIGSKPPCPYASTLKKYCAMIQTRRGYVFEELTQAMNDDPARISELVAAFEGDDDAKAQTLAMHPKQSMKKSLEKCGLNRDQVRAKLVTEAEAASKTDSGGDLSRDFAVVGMWAPDRAMQIWKRECAGHPFSDPADHSEMPRMDKYWKSNPRYLEFCSLTTADAMGKGPKDFSHIWTDEGALTSD